MDAHASWVIYEEAAKVAPLNPWSSGKTKSGAYTLEELQVASSFDVFQIVAPSTLLSFDHHDQVCSAVFGGLYILILKQNTPPLGVPLSVAQSSVHSEVTNTPRNIILEEQPSDDDDIDQG